MAYKQLLLFAAVIVLFVLVVSCSEDNDVIVQEPIDSLALVQTGCLGCHIDAEKLEALAIPEETGGSSGEG